MINLVIVSIFIGSFIVTSYRSTVSQTDKTPYRTSINEKVHVDGIAVHPSLLCAVAKVKMKGNNFKLCKRNLKGCDLSKIHYKDTIFIEQIGFKVVNDVMASKTKMNSMFDVWVPNLETEQQHHKKFKSKKLKVWIIMEKQK